jgi:hypothetical protein
MIGDEMSHAFPMLRAGGLFIMLAGLGVALGGVFPPQRKLLLALGGGLATVVICLSASALSQPFGPPSNAQIAALVGSIALELLLVALVVKRFQAAGERTFFLAILFVVGVHFLPMALAFGPLCVALGAAAIANASVGLWRMRDAPLTTLWLMDGAIKILFGGLMYASGGS